MTPKTKENYSFKSKGATVRDSFQTPRYATELLLPYIPEYIIHAWEPAAGEGRMGKIFEHFLGSGRVHMTEVNGNYPYHDFLTGNIPNNIPLDECSLVGTNPPFSLKEKFLNVCLSIQLSRGSAYALLIPEGWPLWIQRAIEKYGAQLIIPERRIDYITPLTLRNIPRKELWRNRRDLFKDWNKFSQVPESTWDFLIDGFGKEYVFETLEEAPEDMIRRSSSSDFHSMWIVGGFNLPNRVNFAPLSNDDKKRIL